MGFLSCISSCFRWRLLSSRPPRCFLSFHRCTGLRLCGTLTQDLTLQMWLGTDRPDGVMLAFSAQALSISCICPRLHRSARDCARKRKEGERQRLRAGLQGTTDRTHRTPDIAKAECGRNYLPAWARPAQTFPTIHDLSLRSLFWLNLYHHYGVSVVRGLTRHSSAATRRHSAPSPATVFYLDAVDVLICVGSEHKMQPFHSFQADNIASCCYGNASCIQTQPIHSRPYLATLLPGR